jgi:alkanesulfonate monooxygenase SsuD/methylene tetrahydromethanopterin reductase-like flavin-dependent oxidoreductase (luciferase family)
MRVRTEACAVAAATAADVVRLVAPDLDRARALRSAVHDAAIDVGRPPSELRYLAEAYVVLAGDDESARARLDLVEALDGPGVGGGALVVAGTPQRLAQVVTDWADVGVADGFLLHPAALDADLEAIATGLVPALQARGRFPRTRRGSTLRETLGLAPAVELVAG